MCGQPRLGRTSTQVPTQILHPAGAIKRCSMGTNFQCTAIALCLRTQQYGADPAVQQVVEGCCLCTGGGQDQFSFQITPSKSLTSVCPKVLSENRGPLIVTAGCTKQTPLLALSTATWSLLQSQTRAKFPGWCNKEIALFLGWCSLSHLGGLNPH